VFSYFVKLQAPKKWFKANVDVVLPLYSANMRFKRGFIFQQALFLPFPFFVFLAFFRIVIGTLESLDYALFVSHQHPDGQVCFLPLSFRDGY
jgi:abelson tyrosine-protein kinase 1